MTNPVAQDALDKVGEAATAAISNAAGAVADPKTAIKMAKSKGRKAAPLVAVALMILALVAVWSRRQRN